MRDWTPLVGFGSGITVAAGATAYLVMYPIPDFDVGDAEFLIEDEEERHLFLERVVGNVWVAWSQPADGSIDWELLPMGVDYETLAVLEPFATDWVVNSSEWANVKFWDRRSYQFGDTFARPSRFDHPYWTEVDIHPRMILGSGRNLWPVLAMHNNHLAVDAIFSHRLRGFWK